MKIENFSSRILIIIGAVCFGLSLTAVLVLIFNIENLKIMQTLQTILLFGFPAVFCAIFFAKKPNTFLNLQKTSAKNYLFTALFTFSAIPAINFFAWLNAQMRLPKFLHSLEVWLQTTETEAMKLTEQMLSVSTVGGLAVNLVVIALLAAVCEELFFRGLLQKTLLEKMNKHAAIWLTAVIFSAIHLQFYGFLPRMLLGAAFGYMAVCSGSLFLPILAHFINNAVSVIAFFVAKKQDLSIDLDKFGADNEWYLGLIFVPICLWFLWKIKLYKLNIYTKNIPFLKEMEY